MKTGNKLVPWLNSDFSVRSFCFSIRKKCKIFCWDNPKPGQADNPQKFEKKKRRRRRYEKEKIEKFKTLKRKRKNPTLHRSLIGTIDTEPWSNGDTDDDRSKAFHVKSSVAFVAEKKLVVSFSGAAFLAGDVAVAVVFFLCNDRHGFRHYLVHWSHLLRWWRFGGGSSRWSLRSSPRGD